MERHAIAPRDGWQRTVEAQGLIWHGAGVEPYWDDSAYYAFTLAEIETIEAAAETVHGLFLEAGEAIVADPRLMALFGIPDFCQQAVRDAWRDGPPALDYGRFDFGYAAGGEPKLFEFNCDTPTSMLETALVQWEWKEDVFPGLDQFNSLHERLIARWAEIAPRLPGGRAWFTHIADPSHEDTITTTYMRDLASQAGVETHAVVIDDIGVDAGGRVVDHEDRLISAVFKLYPWEWIVNERYGRDIVRHLPDTIWIEPIWKMIWSNKAVLDVLWRLFPHHPNLLAATTVRRDARFSHVAKPILAREGANVRVVERGRTIAETGGDYRADASVYQEYFELPAFDGGRPVLGCWIVGGEAAGMGIREDGLITGNRAKFIPHVIRG